jgi:hypothetical protein
MTTKLKLVQGDTLPAVILSVVDKTTGAAFDLSAATCLLKFRAVGEEDIKDEIVCGKLTGWVNPDGDVIEDPPYDVAGKGGRLIAYWNPDSLDTPGEYEGEVESTFPDGKIQTVYEVVKFSVRPQF